MNIDEANRRSKFHESAEHQEGKIKDFVLSLDIISSLTTATSAPVSNEQQMNSAAMPLYSLTKINSTRTTVYTKSSEKMVTKVKNPEAIECCEVKIDYWFQEDVWQQLFGQLLLIILITSRWLITRSGLTVNQRSLILVISVATAADTLNFFCYLNLELVYRNKYLLYSALLIISLSLLQFVFLHVEDSLNSMNKNGHTNNNNNNNNNNNYSNNANIGNNNNNNNNSSTSQLDETANDENTMINNGNKYPLFFKKHQYIKQPFYDGSSPNTPREQHSTITSFICCCFEQQDPLFFILLAGLFLHDGSYLTFRIFIVAKLGWTQTNDLDPAFSFYLIKNIFIIITQVYKVYCVSSDRRNKKYFDDYRHLMMNNQNLPTTNNPYRFAQLYTDVGSPLASKAPLYKSMSTLGSNQIYFENSPNLYKPALHPALFSQQQQQQQQQQQATSSITESVLAVMAQDYSIQRQLHSNEGVSYYHPTITPTLSTPANPFTAKVGKALYGLPFLSRSKGSMNTGNFLSATKNQYQGGQAVNPMTAGAGSKLLKSSKI